MSTATVAWFDDLGLADLPAVGGKNASLGEMVQGLATSGVRVPEGFAVTADAYHEVVRANKIAPAMERDLAELRAGSASLRATSQRLRSRLLGADLPDEIAHRIRECYQQLCRRTGQPDVPVAVRSSATAEDLPDASFAGQQETFLNVHGGDDVLEACRRCYASLFTDRAITYREFHGFDHLQVGLSVGVQRMVDADQGSSGVMFSLDTESGFPRVVVISATWGLGETIVQGIVDPDKYVVHKSLLDRAPCPIVERTRGAKMQKMVYGTDGSGTRLVATDVEERRSLVLDDEDILRLARWAVMIEEHYGRPMDMEWAKDGQTGELFMLQARPETVQARRDQNRFTVHHLTGSGPLLLTGAAIGDAIATGQAHVVRRVEDIDTFPTGAVLVAEMTDPDWVPAMKRAVGVVTDHGGTTSHAAIVSRELGLPAVVGTGAATSTLVAGQRITLSCAEGEQGRVYDGAVPFTIEEVDLGSIPETQTALMVNVASPAAAFRWWRLPTDGVGLARMEFIIANVIQAHPLALLHPERVPDAAARARIAELTVGYPDGAEYFVDTLARGVAKLATPYYPHRVIVRLSDFKSNEYAHLLGGQAFEEVEANPMLGFRGASRYYHPRYREGFALECRALERVRGRLGFENVAVMVPFCRTPAEADLVLAEMTAHGLQRGRDGLRVYMMCEIPSNVVLADQFATRFDGFSIGSNDLTQLVLGIDRDSDVLRPLFDERDEAVTRMISQVITTAHDAGISVGICGQAPSDHLDFAGFLVRAGIDSISLNPDSFLRTARFVADAEK